jgi:hypothetical protein
MAFDCSCCCSHLGCKSVVWSLLTHLKPPTVIAGGDSPMASFLTRIIGAAELMRGKDMHDCAPAPNVLTHLG